MATGTMATAAGAAVLLCYVLKRTLASKGEDDAGDRAAGDPSRSGRPSKRRIARRQPSQAPATLFEAIATLAETLRFTYSETLGKWPIGDLAFGIKYLMTDEKAGKWGFVSRGIGWVSIVLGMFPLSNLA